MTEIDAEAIVVLIDKVKALIPVIAQQMVTDTERVVSLERAGRLEEARAVASPWIQAVNRLRTTARFEEPT